MSPKRHAIRSRLDNCLFSGSGQEETVGKDIKWVSLYGHDNEVSHCSFVDKKILGSLLVVWIDPQVVPAHRIHDCFFTHPFSLRENGSSVNGQEMIRIGTSAVSMSEVRCEVYDNYFYRCDGEVEIISNKSCGNIYRNNVFDSCQGTLTLRHGNGCTVDGNYFFGRGVANTGGVRIIGERHRVFNNYFEELAGRDQRSAISLVRGVENSELYEYFQVRDAQVVFNTIVNCRSGIMANTGSSTSTMPVVESLVAANLIVGNASGAMQAAGDPEHPIVVRAQTPGKVIIEGCSDLRIAGSGIVVSGLWFRNGCSPTGSVIEYRQGSRHATGCRVTQCVIDGFNPESRQTKGNWVQLYGHNNRFDHNTVVGKYNEGVTVAAILNGTDRQHHRIDHNYFGPRPVYGSNGAETIRTGNSFTSHTSSFIVIEDNYFDRCSGEEEIVSVKSGDNIIRRNTFFECEGGVALRHGDRNTVEENLFIGNGKPNTGGVRVINKGHRIRRNCFSGLAGRRSFAPLAVMDGVPDSPDYRYHPVTDVQITDNTFDDCTPILFGLGRDFERTVPPEGVLFARNRINASRDGEVYTPYDDLSGITFSENRITDKRHFKLPDVAAVRKEQTGASWFDYTEPRVRELSGRVLRVEAGRNTLLDAVSASAPGDVIELASPGEYWNDAPVAIRHYLVIRSAPGLDQKPLLRYCGRGGEPMVRIENGGHLDLSGVAFNGLPEEELRDPKGFVATAETMIEDYTLRIVDCDFSRFNRSGTYAVSCLRGTFAPWIEIRDCRFTDLPWDAVVLSRETDFYGRYNVERLEVSNCLFVNVGGRGIDVARYGYDESTAGPDVRISHCTFRNVFNREQGSVIDLQGVQKASVTDCAFDHSGRGGASIRFNEMRWDEITVSRCNLYESGRIASFWNTGIGDDMTGYEPCYADPQAGDYRQAPDSPLAGRATDGTNVGIN